MRGRVDQRERAWRLSAIVLAAAALTVAVKAASHSPTDATIPTLRIDLNTAPAAHLRLLDGIGPSLAGAIVTDREEHGPYRSLSDVDRTPRIGPRTLRGIAPDVSLASDAP